MVWLNFVVTASIGQCGFRRSQRGQRPQASPKCRDRLQTMVYQMYKVNLTLETKPSIVDLREIPENPLLPIVLFSIYIHNKYDVPNCKLVDLPTDLRPLFFLLGYRYLFVCGSL
ncbi:hypothetical protein P7H12_21520 [Paenibacillus larvae]|nr:hypothetical protein [Paenibacillus larvae]MDT2265641.1 hypothetical protein [Paenibacillus larvae]